jgi:hypothetical protein
MKRLVSCRSRRGALALRLVATLLLAVILSDVVGDADCDIPNTAVAADVSMSAGGGAGSGEPCASFCVPDCFCCSRSVGAAAVIAPPRPIPLTVLDTPDRERWPQGVRPVIDHPPLLRG